MCTKSVLAQIKTPQKGNNRQQMNPLFNVNKSSLTRENLG